MNLQRTSRYILSAALVCGLSAPAMAEITFLEHFNDNGSPPNYDPHSAQGDYGLGLATFNSVAPGFASGNAPAQVAGFFPGSTPTNGAVNIKSVTGVGYDTVAYDGPGNAGPQGATTGGWTIGAWIKPDGPNALRLMLGSTDGGRDHLDFSWGQNYGAGGPNGYASRVDYFENHYNPTTVSTELDLASLTSGLGANNLTASQINNHWFYIAASVDLDHTFDSGTATGVGTIAGYIYDEHGNLLTSGAANLNHVAGGAFAPAGQSGSYISLGDYVTGSNAADELVVYDTALSQQELSSSVAFMVAGNQLAVPEPASVALLGVGAMLLIRRRREA